MSKGSDGFDGSGNIRLTRMARFRVCALLKKPWQKQRCDVEMLYVDDECNRTTRRKIRAGRSSKDSQIAVNAWVLLNVQ